MSAKELIELAKSVGVGVGRNRPGVYRWTKVENGKCVDREFHGTYPAFARFIKQQVEQYRFLNS